MLLVSVLILATALLRIGFAVEGLPNFMPLMALAIVGPAVVDRKYYWAFPVGTLIVSDLVLNQMYGVALLHPWTLIAALLYFAAALYGRWLAQFKPNFSLLGSAFAGTTAFYFISNTLVFFTSSQYAKTFAGFIQALTVGLPGYPPTWMFYRNSLIGDLSFTLIVVVALKVSQKNWGRTGKRVYA